MRKYLTSLIVGIIGLSIMTWLIMTLLPYPELKNLPTYTRALSLLEKGKAGTKSAELSL